MRLAGYGLEDAYAEQPDMGVIRRHRTVSDLIKYQPRGIRPTGPVRPKPFTKNRRDGAATAFPHPMNGHRQVRAPCRKSANKRLMHRSKLHRYSITSSERASDRCLRWTVNKALIKSLTQE
jgi:hypothetical protein